MQDELRGGLRRSEMPRRYGASAVIKSALVVRRKSIRRSRLHQAPMV
jgi:hypothetical protein